MFLTIGLIVLVLWALGFFVFPIVAIGGLIHVLLVIAIIMILVHIIRGRPVV